MISGAAHDAGAMALRLPAAMLFVPSHKGISHSPLEHTDDRLLVQGAQLLLESVVELTSHAYRVRSAKGRRSSQ
jgi:N-carbamoyl-L-amino-acid hydrolase